VVSTRVIGGFGAASTVSAHLTIVLLGLLLWAVSGHLVWLATISLVFWGYGGGPAISGQQARLIAADPEAGSASVALNTSVLYAGQALGTTLGGVLIDSGFMVWNGAVASVLLVVALGVSLAVKRGMQS
jgi:MFS transporter, DHA1 family, inner membrane transport protein